MSTFCTVQLTLIDIYIKSTKMGDNY
jgi:hypothetical protein